MNLTDEVGDRELELERMRGARLVTRRQSMTPAEVVADRGGLRDHHVAMYEHGRREDRMPGVASVVEREHRLDAATLAARLAGDVDVLRAGLLENEAHELAAPGDFGPVVERVGGRHGEFSGW